ncbi:hypothetical protein BTE77_27840 [Ensifer adhaerens]|nr:hypothetical protein BTE77_27840 [Ensifer adhaerens]
MTAPILSDLLKSTRNSLKRRSVFGRCCLYLSPSQLSAFVANFNTMVALAEELEEELIVAETRLASRSASITRLYPRRQAFRAPSPDDGGDAA